MKTTVQSNSKRRNSTPSENPIRIIHKKRKNGFHNRT